MNIFIMFPGYLLLVSCLLQLGLAWSFNGNALFAYLSVIPTTTTASAKTTSELAVQATTIRILIESVVATAETEVGAQTWATTMTLPGSSTMSVEYNTRIHSTTDTPMLYGKDDFNENVYSSSEIPVTTAYILRPSMATLRNGQTQEIRAVVGTLVGEQYHPEPTPWPVSQNVNRSVRLCECWSDDELFSPEELDKMEEWAEAVITKFVRVYTWFYDNWMTLLTHHSRILSSERNCERVQIVLSYFGSCADLSPAHLRITHSPYRNTINHSFLHNALGLSPHKSQSLPQYIN